MRTLGQIEAFLLDMDGTFTVDRRLMPRARLLLDTLTRRNIPYLFLTNNSSARAANYSATFEQLGLSIPAERILTSGEATASYMLRHTSQRRVYLLGTPELEAEFNEKGFILTDQDPEAVVLGFDKTLTYKKLQTACFLVADGLPYWATHPDNTCITAQGLIPDAGAFIAAIERVTRRTPRVIGKPEPEMVEAALSRLGSSAHRTAMVGDQLDTDLTMAQRAGLFGVLVLSGETSRERLEAQKEVQPDLVLEHIGELYDLLEGEPGLSFSTPP